MDTSRVLNLPNLLFMKHLNADSMVVTKCNERVVIEATLSEVLSALLMLCLGEEKRVIPLPRDTTGAHTTNAHTAISPTSLIYSHPCLFQVEHLYDGIPSQVVRYRALEALKDDPSKYPLHTTDLLGTCWNPQLCRVFDALLVQLIGEDGTGNTSNALCKELLGRFGHTYHSLSTTVNFACPTPTPRTQLLLARSVDDGINTPGLIQLAHSHSLRRTVGSCGRSSEYINTVLHLVRQAYQVDAKINSSKLQEKHRLGCVQAVVLLMPTTSLSNLLCPLYEQPGLASVANTVKSEAAYLTRAVNAVSSRNVSVTRSSIPGRPCNFIYTHYIHLYTRVYTCIHVYTPIYTYIHLYTPINTYVHLYTPIYTYIRTIYTLYTHYTHTIYTLFQAVHSMCHVSMDQQCRSY